MVKLPANVEISVTNSSRAGSAEGRSVFMPQLEGARGIAALAVAIFHTLGFQQVDNRWLTLVPLWEVDTGRQVAMKLMTALFNGGAAVSFFFVLSGFVLGRSLSREKRLGASVAASFVLARVKRIYPVYAISTVAFVLAYNCAHRFMPELPTYGGWDTLVNLAMADFSFKINQPLWSVVVELTVTPLIFLAAIASRHRWRTRVGLLAMTLAALFLGQYFVAPILVAPGVLFFVIWVLRFSFMFVLGVFIAEMNLSGLSKGMTRIIFVSAVGCLLVPRILFHYDATPTLLLEAAGSAAIILLLALGRSGPTAQFLLMPPIRLLGRISYSFYAFHFLAPVLILHLLMRPFPTLMSHSPFFGSLILAALSIPATLCLAVASYRLVERPMTHLRFQFAE